MGKSTLLTQLALKVTDTTLYVCGEESPSQVKLRIQRLDNNIKDSQLYLLPETNVETIVESSAKGLKNVKLMIIDSIQTLWTQRLSGMAGSVGQIRESANILTEFAKRNHIPVFLVGHVTKEGEIAGPKILEHLVDTVLYLEGEKFAEYRILRAVKNRFGPTDEVGIFSMGQKGMEEINNPAKIFLESDGKNKRTKNERIGSVTVVTMQGTRPILVEIQALCVSSPIPVPRRVARGIDTNRLQILCAVLQKKAGISLYNQDVFLSVAGGLKVSEPGIDFGICMAVASSYKNKTLTEKTAVIGEVGLLGEIRSVAFLEKRQKQAKALGYTNILGPDKYRNLASALVDLT
jgi:DNA repair protein RadA/Sms